MYGTCNNKIPFTGNTKSRSRTSWSSSTYSGKRTPTHIFYSKSYILKKSFEEARNIQRKGRVGKKRLEELHVLRFKKN